MLASLSASANVLEKPNREIEKNELWSSLGRGGGPRTQNTYGAFDYDEPRRSNNSKSPNKRDYGDVVRSTPSSMVRHLRTHSASTLSARSYSDNSQSATSTSNFFRHQNLGKISNLPLELSALVNLITAQRMRIYTFGTFLVPAVLDGKKVWLQVEAKLTGNELAFWRPDDDTGVAKTDFADAIRPGYINMVDSEPELSPNGTEIYIMQSFHQKSCLKFTDKEHAEKWFAAILLSKFEYVSLNEAFTAVLLSIKGQHLSDLYSLLSPKKYVKCDWVHIRLPQVSPSWIKAFMVIHPSTRKRLGCIELYSGDKLSKKNLVAYISDVSTAYNVYPENPDIIHLNSLMKLEGKVHVQKNQEHLFSSQMPSKSRLSPENSPASNSSASGNSFQKTTMAFYQYAPITMPESDLKVLKRGISSYFKKHSDQFNTASLVYILTDGHYGVSESETMIRNFIHIVDAFKIYGRPKRFISSRTDPLSLLFGLPSLPRCHYMLVNDAHFAVKKTGKSAPQDWLLHLKTHLLEKNPNYKGEGDIYLLYNDLESDSSFLGSREVAKFTLEVNSDKSNQISNSTYLSDDDKLASGSSPIITSKKSPSQTNFLGAPFKFEPDSSSYKPSSSPGKQHYYRTLLPSFS